MSTQRTICFIVGIENWFKQLTDVLNCLCFFVIYRRPDSKCLCHQYKNLFVFSTFKSIQINISFALWFLSVDMKLDFIWKLRCRSICLNSIKCDQFWRKEVRNMVENHLRFFDDQSSPIRPTRDRLTYAKYTHVFVESRPRIMPAWASQRTTMDFFAQCVTPQTVHPRVHLMTHT